MNTGQIKSLRNSADDAAVAELGGMCAAALAAAGIQAMPNPHPDGSTLWRRWQIGAVRYDPTEIVSREKNSKPGRGRAKKGARGEWSPVEMSILRTWYCLETTAQIAARLRQRTQKAVQCKIWRHREELEAFIAQDRAL